MARQDAVRRALDAQADHQHEHLAAGGGGGGGRRPDAANSDLHLLHLGLLPQLQVRLRAQLHPRATTTRAVRLALPKTLHKTRPTLWAFENKKMEQRTSLDDETHAFETTRSKGTRGKRGGRSTMITAHTPSPFQSLDTRCDQVHASPAPRRSATDPNTRQAEDAVGWERHWFQVLGPVHAWAHGTDARRLRTQWAGGMYAALTA